MTMTSRVTMRPDLYDLQRLHLFRIQSIDAKLVIVDWVRLNGEVADFIRNHTARRPVCSSTPGG